MKTIRSYFLSICLAATGAFGQVNVLTQHNDIARTGQNTSETILTPANVSSGKFGKLFSVTLDGQVYAQPLYLSALAIPGAGTHNVVFVATMHDSLYAIDGDSGAVLWQITLLDAAHGAVAGATTDPASDPGCTELAGTEFGITGTPVIDPAAGVIYLVGKTFENGYAVQRLHKLNITTGAEMAKSPVTLSASVAGTGTGSSGGVLSFDPKWENQRAGLLLLNGIVYMAFASYCDNGPFHGWIMAYNVSSMTQTSVFTPTPNSTGSGIWMSGTGLAADVPAGSPFGRMFVPTGNGSYDATTPYGTNTMDYGVDVVRLDLTNGVMKVTDAFTPLDQLSLNTNDQDLASGGVILLPDQPLAGHTHQLLACGKTGDIYVVDRDNLGGYSTTANHIIEYVAPNQIGGCFSAPAVWNNIVYYWGDEDPLKQFNIVDGLMNDYWLVRSSETMHFPASTPSISANGITNGIVWSIDGSNYIDSGYTPGPSILYAHDATNVATTLYSSATNLARDNPGPAGKMVVPTIANGKVYVGSFGELSVFGLLTTGFSLAAAQPSASVQPGGSVADTITVTPIDGFTGTVTFSASGLPAGLTASFSAETAGVASVTFAASSSTKTGSYPVAITGTSGSISNKVTVTVNVTSAASFTLTANPTALSLTPGQSATSSISVAPSGGFTGAVTLSAAGLPSGVTASFGAISGGVSVMTIAAAGTATVQTFTVRITGTSGTLTASTGVTVTVTAKPAFGLTASPAPLSITAGKSANLNVSVTPANGFAGSVSFAVAGLPAGLTAAFNPSSSATGTTVTFTAASTLTAQTYQVVITGTSGSLSSAVTFSVVVTAGASFKLSANPAALTVVQGQTGSSSITVTPSGGFSGAVTFSASGLPTGATAAFGAETGGVSAMTITTASGTTPGTYAVTVVGASGSLSSATGVSLTVSAVVSTAPVSVNLASAYNVYGVFNNGTSPTNGGMDNNGDAYSGNLLPTSGTTLGVPFVRGATGVADCVSNATIALPAGSFGHVRMLATGVNGNQVNQAFVVSYTDGTSSTFTQSLSDWLSSQGYTGETRVINMAYRVVPGGGTQNNAVGLYGYSFAINPAKVVKSIKLPANRDVVVIGMTLSN